MYINERVSYNNIKKYKLDKQWEKYFQKSFDPYNPFCKVHWTINREKDIFFSNMSSFNKDSFLIQEALLCWKGIYLHLTFHVFSKESNHIKWVLKRLGAEKVFHTTLKEIRNELRLVLNINAECHLKNLAQ